jgi:S-adenosylmethionine hydrolase
MSRIVTLLTDFGTADPYVASMKGVIYSICPRAVVVDAGHDIPPHDIRAASLFVSAAVPYYPEGSIHVIVVDPGVGTGRIPLAAAAGGRIFVCPDNGILTLYLRRFPLEAARRIADPRCALDEISATFHGRDIFAPTAAHLACGMDIGAVGPLMERIVSLDLPEPTVDSAGIVHGEIIHVDRFGNLISNIPRSLWLRSDTEARMRAGECSIDGIASSYGACATGELLAVWGSAGFLEIAVNQGSAAERLALSSGSRLSLSAKGQQIPKPNRKP